MDLGQLSALVERLRGRWRRQFLAAGIVAAAVVNVHRKKGSRPRSPEDFLPATLREERKKSGPELLALALQANQLLGGRDLRNTRETELNEDGEPAR